MSMNVSDMAKDFFQCYSTKFLANLALVHDRDNIVTYMEWGYKPIVI